MARSVLVFLLILAGALAAPSSNEVEIIENPTEHLCNPYTFFKDDCNFCICSKDGSKAICSRMDCERAFNPDGSLKLPDELLKNPLIKEIGKLFHRLKEIRNRHGIGLDVPRNLVNP